MQRSSRAAWFRVNVPGPQVFAINMVVTRSEKRDNSLGEPNQCQNPPSQYETQRQEVEANFAITGPSQRLGGQEVKVTHRKRL